MRSIHLPIPQSKKHVKLKKCWHGMMITNRALALGIWESPIPIIMLMLSNQIGSTHSILEHWLIFRTLSNVSVSLSPVNVQGEQQLQDPHSTVVSTFNYFYDCFHQVDIRKRVILVRLFNKDIKLILWFLNPSVLTCNKIFLIISFCT